MTTGRLLPGVFAEERHLVPANAPTHHSAHLGERYRAVCRALCIPANSGGRDTWRRWPICPNCARHLLGGALIPLDTSLN
ncbi:hypothetical protein GCM10010492_33340 [Saccharothrix mutabilis subsp. mutabilis]|uniref:Uncharacterized protein n=1 Tax=Saccharothrix mutabilis subsp. mutabilis TaxID=66855 RepID=A0ABN0TWS0_9PSEU